MTSFYDWYADLPVASPQVFGDQTDVPESGDWWDATYLIMWGSNVPVTRTPDAHWMAEARYRGSEGRRWSRRTTPTTRSSPTTWLPAQPGTDGALAMAMGHVMLKEFFVERRVPFFVDYVQRYTDLPFLVTLEEPRTTARTCPGSSSPRPISATTGEGAAWKTVLVDGRTGEPVVPNGSLGFRYTDDGRGPVEPRPRTAWPRSSPCSAATGSRARCCCRASTPSTAPAGSCAAACRCAAWRAGWSRTVFDLMLAQYGVRRAGPAGGRGRRATTTPPSPTPPRGRSRSPAVSAAQVVRVGARVGRATPRSPTAAP